MAGAGIHIDLSGIKALERRLAALGGFDAGDLLDVIGAQVESQARRRISEEKQAPDGAAWPNWSEEYAATRHSGHSLLEGEGDLIGSLDHVVSGNEVEIGSNLIYAATHQFGDEERNIQARPYLGLSAGDEAEIERTILDWFREIGVGA
ncbi:MAG TPA: phage virion morphogenesis protein [Arenimonas sp.]|nr:phage virion morphogenesis protein [Arenimonas sp.]